MDHRDPRPPRTTAREKNRPARAGQLRAIWPEIRAAIAEGQSLATIRQWPEEEAGIIVTTVQSLGPNLTRTRRKEQAAPAVPTRWPKPKLPLLIVRHVSPTPALPALNRRHIAWPALFNRREHRLCAWRRRLPTRVCPAWEYRATESSPDSLLTQATLAEIAPAPTALPLPAIPATSRFSAVASFSFCPDRSLSTV